MAQKKLPAAVDCAKCHVQGRTMAATQMATALQPAGGALAMKTHPKLTLQKGPYTYLVETKDGVTTYGVSDGERTISHKVSWGFGAANQTWVYEQDGRFYESLMSFYVSINGLAVTTGDEGIVPKTLEEAAGRLLTASDVTECFGCHSTPAAGGGKFSVATVHPGIQCVQCHLGTEQHATNAVKREWVPADLGTISAEGMSSLCGRCHRTWEKVVRTRSKGETNVRFPAYRIANSRCFDGADARISCIACHDVHKLLERVESSYDEKCLACHGGVKRVGAVAPPKDAKVCPVAKADCASCHMPKVALPGGLLKFTDHQIRVVRAGEPFPD